MSATQAMPTPNGRRGPGRRRPGGRARRRSLAAATVVGLLSASLTAGGWNATPAAADGDDAFTPFSVVDGCDYDGEVFAGARAECEGQAPRNVRIDMFDYWIGADRFATDSTPEWGTAPAEATRNRGINQDRVLKFSKFNRAGQLVWNQPELSATAYADYGYAALDINKNASGPTTAIVRTTLTDGFPVLAGNATTDDESAGQHTDRSLAYLFDPDLTGVQGRYVAADVAPTLFLRDAQGAYVYDSATNFATIAGVADPQTDGFTLYNSPSPTAGGQFFPWNTFDELGTANGSVGAGVNHYFGMRMLSSFSQPPGGLNAHNDMVFSFSGDDDLWVFIDGVLVLNLGGIHGRVAGSINFASGEVTQDGLADTTLRQLFLDAGVGSTVEWNGDTFADWTPHDLSLFYLERGNYDSNLLITTNLVAPGEVALTATKALVDGDLAEGAFEFGVFEPGGDEPIRTATNAADGSVAFEPIVYEAEGTYEYIIRELLPDDPDPYISYDETEYRAVVTVAPDANDLGVLVTSLTYYLGEDPLGATDMPAFTNLAAGEVTWEKVDDGDPAVRLAGSQWTLTRLVDGGEDVAIEVVDNGLNDADDTAGVIHVENLPWGDYELRETVAPAFYLGITDPVEFTIGEGAGASISHVLGQIVNLPEPGLLMWEKVDPSGNLVGGSEWRLTGPGLGEDGIVIVDDGDNDEGGGTPGLLAIDDLAWGTYTLEEITPPVGHRLDEDADPITFTIGPDDPENDVYLVWELVGDDAIVNEPILGTVTWEKVDSVQGILLVGSEWLLTRVDDDDDEGVILFADAGDGGVVVIDNEDPDIDDRDGVFQVTDLPWGDYTLVETVAPLGYRLDPTVHEFTIDAETLSVFFTGEHDSALANEQIPPVSLPLTGGRGIEVYLAAGGVVLALAIGLGARQHRQSRRPGSTRSLT